MLLEVPKDSPTHKERLNALKLALMIETNDAGPQEDKDYPRWLAVHMPSARSMGYGVTSTSTMFDCFCKVGRLMDDAGIAAYGTTEREAIRKVCENLDLPCDL